MERVLASFHLSRKFLCVSVTGSVSITKPITFGKDAALLRLAPLWPFVAPLELAGKATFLEL